jgi:hypothetical protein
VRALAYAVGALVLVSWAWSAFADAGEVKLDYQVDPSCAGQDAFVSEVHARSPRIRFAPDATRTLVVRVEAKGGKLTGRIELGGTQRVVAGATCEEVISALGLVTALALDPLASTAPNPTASSSSSAAPTASSTTTTSTNTGAPDAGADVVVVSEDERELPVEKRKWSFAAGADAEVVLGAGPDPMFAVPVFFEVARALGQHFALGGAARFVHADDTSLTGGIGADFDWTVGALDLCAIVRAGRFRLDACERSAFGVLEAHGLGILPARSAARPWVDLGLALALRARVFGPFFVEATGHVGAVLVRDRFFLEPNQTVFQAPNFTGEVGGGLGFEIW